MADPGHRLTASVVGCGAGGRLSIQGLMRSDYFELVAVADLQPSVLGALATEIPGLRTFTDYRHMFRECPTDVVCVSTYPPSHEEVALAALELPLKGILVEKPLGHTAASGRRIVNAIKERELPMAVPHGLLAKRTPLEIIERVQKGEIGQLKLVDIQCTGWDIINAGIHWLDYFVTLTGNEPIDHVLAQCDTSTRTYRDGMQVETVGLTFGQTSSGVRVMMMTGDTITIDRPAKSTLFRLIGTEGQIEFWGWENGYTILNADHPHGELVVPQEFSVTGHQRHLENMARMVIQGDAEYSIPDGSLLALEMCEAAYPSSREGCLVRFPFEAFTPPSPTDWVPGIPYSGVGGGRNGRML